jgi:RNA polymerase sigma-70 factor (ECF subfamily)
MSQSVLPQANARTISKSPVDRSEDARRVARVLAGDESAFSEIYKEFFPRVFSFCLKRVGDRAEAEDLAQETFVQLYRSLASFEGRSSLMTWTFGIAHHVCARYFRHCSRWMVGSRNAREYEDRGTDPGLERQIDASRALARCGEVLESSRRPSHRQIFHLRYNEKKSIRKIAEEVGKSSEAVKISLRRSRNALSEGVPELESVLRQAV